MHPLTSMWRTSSSSPAHSQYSLGIWLLLLALMFTLATSAPHRHSHHKEKKVSSDDDYEYRDFNDYSSGVAIDYAKVTKKTATSPGTEAAGSAVIDDSAQGGTTTNHNFQKTNRYPKMRKFHDSHNDEQRRWLEALFSAQKKRK